MRRSVASCLATVLLAFASFGWADERTGYPFKIEPSKAIQRLPELDPSPDARLSADEQAFLERLSDGKTGKELPLAEAALWASGVTDPARRQEYSARIDAIVAGARERMSATATPTVKGESLLKYLHETAMAKGYESHQSSLAELLESGKFNCVSSAVLYNAIARRLGLAVKAVEHPGSIIAGHVYSVLDAGGKRIRVETTNAQGFNKDEVVLQRHDREVGDLGLAALIYANRSAESAKSKHYITAARTGFGALALDPDSPTAANNTAAAFVNWGNDASKEGKYETALRVMAFGLELSPKHSGLNNNYKIAWHDYAAAAYKSGNSAEAVARLRRAAKAMPDGDFVRGQADLFVERGEKQIKDSKWDEALATAVEGLKVVDRPAMKRLEEWRVGVYRRWSQTAIKAGDFEHGAAALAKGLTALPRNKDLADGIAYLAQEWLAAADKDHGPPAATKAYERLRKQFPKADKLPEIATSHAQRAIRKQIEAGRFTEATALVAAYEPLTSGAKESAKLGGYAYDGWARSHAKKGEWEAAMKVYADGLRAYPGESMLTQNAVATVDQWASKSLDAKDYTDAARVYRRGLEVVPNDSHLKHNLEVCERNLKKP